MTFTLLSNFFIVTLHLVDLGLPKFHFSTLNTQLKTSFNCCSILYISVTALKHTFNIHECIFFSIALLSRISVVGGFHCCSYSCVCGDRSLLQHYEALTRNEYQHGVVSACLGFCSVSFSVVLNPPLPVPNSLHNYAIHINFRATDGRDTKIIGVWKKGLVI